MKLIAAGQVVSWEGGSLWVLDVSPNAPGRNETHAHHAFQLTFSLGGKFSLFLKDRTLSGPFALVAPDTPHAFGATGLVAHLFIEPESRAGRALRQLIAGQPAAEMSVEQVQDAPDLFSRAFMQSLETRSALRDAGKLVCTRIAGHVRTVEPDRRVRHMIKWANENLDGIVGLKQASTGTGLSPSRASHLFVEETGLPFRTYVLWLRLTRAVDLHAGGQSLTDAAHLAGFADSAHLSRTFKRMFGVPAASLDMS